MGLSCSALLQSRSIEIEDKDPVVYSFFEDEFLRLRDFLMVAHKSNILFDEVPANYHRNNTIRVALFRSILEGYIKIMYLFKNCKYSDDSDIRFELIVSAFREEYRKYRNGLFDSGLFKLPELNGNCEKNLDISRIINIIKKDLHSDEEKTAMDETYCMYRYCCFFSHGNISEVILKSAECEIFGHFDIYPAIEGIASNYLTLFANLIDSSDLLAETYNMKHASKFYINLSNS